MVERLISKRVAASTLVEVLVSMVIISVVFAITVLIFVNVQRTTRSAALTRAEIAANNIMNKTLISKDLTEAKVACGAYWIVKQVTPQGNQDKLYVVLIDVATREGEVLMSTRRLLFKP